MRLYLLPISTRRTLLYCEKLNAHTSESKTVVDKATTRAAKLWADWEKKEKGWQKTVVTYGNQLFRRIPYEEWALKSVPPLSTRRKEDELQGKEKVQIVYPETVIPTTKALGVLQTLGTERQALHRQRLIYCFVGMPISAPFALVPVIPNLPFFYLVYRAWSHWRAMAGGKHLQFLSSNNLLALAPSPVLDSIYPALLPSGTTSKSPSEPAKSDSAAPSHAATAEEETLLLTQEGGRELVKALDVPELEVEVERAIWQVETAIKKGREEKIKAASQTGSPTPKSEKDER
ncbi:mitochondrial K+-H+ exchange-related-domain-containing protein [Xylariales sp. AK1849]|nr:mitochondrial K+-H+ exchange-related-domain-containing protein [Xylariales sp. AK1849]